MNPSAETRNRKNWPWHSWSAIRVRSALIVYATYFCIIIGLSMGLRSGFRQAIFDQLDARLSEQISDFSDSVKISNFQFDQAFQQKWDRLQNLLARQQSFVRIYDHHGAIVWQSNTSPEFAIMDTIGVSRSSPYTMKNYRVLDSLLTTPDNHQWTVKSGVGLQSLHPLLARTDRMILGYTVVLVVVVPLIAWWIAGIVLRPITLLSEDAEKISKGELAEYLIDRGIGDDVDRLSNTINSLLRKSRHEVRIREEWLTNSAHHLRGPLAAISANVEVVERRLQADSSKTMLQNVLADCKSLTKLVNQLLLLAEAEADSDLLRGKRSPTNLAEAVRHACAMFEQLAADKGIDIELSKVSDCWVLGNRNLLSQVVYNLLDNAIKFSLPGGKIKVDLSSIDGENKCRLVVADNGCGIPEEDLPKITERFFSGRTATDKTESSRSSGLGLSICDTIVASHDGTLSIASASEVGTTVTIALPTISAPPPTPIGGK